MSDQLFTVSVDGSLDEVGDWVVKATATFAEGADREALRDQVRVALLQGIVREGLKGRALGKKVARVILDEGDGPTVVHPSVVGLH